MYRAVLEFAAVILLLSSPLRPAAATDITCDLCDKLARAPEKNATDYEQSVRATISANVKIICAIPGGSVFDLNATSAKNLIAGVPTCWITHGWNPNDAYSKSRDWMVRMLKALLTKGYNVCYVDWKFYASDKDYLRISKLDVPLVAEHVAGKIIESMTANQNLTLNNTIYLGHSLGVSVWKFVADRLNKRYTGQRADLLVAMDPAQPCITFPQLTDGKPNQETARYMQTIHTSSLFGQNANNPCQNLAATLLVKETCQIENAAASAQSLLQGLLDLLKNNKNNTDAANTVQTSALSLFLAFQCTHIIAYEIVINATLNAALCRAYHCLPTSVVLRVGTDCERTCQYSGLFALPSTATDPYCLKKSPSEVFAMLATCGAQTVLSAAASFAPKCYT